MRMVLNNLNQLSQLETILCPFSLLQHPDAMGTGSTQTCVNKYTVPATPMTYPTALVPEAPAQKEVAHNKSLLPQSEMCRPQDLPAAWSSSIAV